MDSFNIKMDEAIIDLSDGFAIKALQQLREMKDNKMFCDVSVKVDDNNIVECHRNIVACTIPYFKDTLNYYAANEVIQMYGINIKIMKRFIDFAYTGKIKIDLSNAKDILFASFSLGLSAVKEKCVKFVIERIDSTNVMDFYNTAAVINHGGLRTSCYEFILKNFNGIFKRDDFLKDFSYDDLLKVLKDDTLCVTSEETVFEAVMDWISHEPNSREIFLVTLLKAIRLFKLSSDYLINAISEHPLIQKSEDSRQHIDEIKSNVLTIDSIEAKDRVSCNLNQEGDVIYIVGGANEDSVELHSDDSSSDIASQVIKKMSTKRHGLSVTKYQNKIYAIGGNNGAELSSVELYDTEKREWSNVSSMNIGRCFAGSCIIGEYIYVCGGRGGINKLSSAEKYSLSTDQWSEISPMMDVRYGVGVTSLNGIVYALGGYSGNGILKTMESFDPRVGKWNYETEMLFGRNLFGTTTFNNKIYVCGGFNSDSLNDCHEYDPKIKRWTSVKPMTNKRYALSLIEYKGKLYGIGGEEGSKIVEIFDANSDTWTTGSELRTERHGFGAVVMLYK